MKLKQYSLSYVRIRPGGRYQILGGHNRSFTINCAKYWVGTYLMGIKYWVGTTTILLYTNRTKY